MHVSKVSPSRGIWGHAPPPRKFSKFATEFSPQEWHIIWFSSPNFFSCLPGKIWVGDVGTRIPNTFILQARRKLGLLIHILCSGSPGWKTNVIPSLYFD